MRSPSAGDRRSPVSASPSDSRSIQSRPSGLSITSTIAGSSRNRGDGRTQRGAQHARAAFDRLRLLEEIATSSPSKAVTRSAGDAQTGRPWIGNN